MNKVLIVTGGSRGIGAATARLAAERGYAVCINYLRNSATAENLAQEIQAKGGKAIAVAADVAQEADVVRMFEEVHRTLGPLNALVNNAGIVERQMRLEEFDAARLTRLFATNVTGSFLCAREAVRRMSTRHGGAGGAIVNVSSVAARLGGPGEYVDYAASKGAIDTMTIGLAKEVATEGIRVNAVRPGIIYTEIHASGGEPDRVERVKESIPMKRGGQAIEVAHAILWLLSDEAVMLEMYDFLHPAKMNCHLERSKGSLHCTPANRTPAGIRPNLRVPYCRNKPSHTRLSLRLYWTNALVLLFLAVPFLSAQQPLSPPRTEAHGEPLPPDWCRDLPRPGYKQLERIPIAGNWFEVYRIRPGVFAIYEPHQYEEVISHLILGSERALLFDTGLGIGDMREVVAQLTKLPVTVLNSHTHFDHIGDDWQFTDILGVDTPYTRLNEKGAAHDQLRDVVVPERFCGAQPRGFDPEHYAIPRFKISRFVKDGDVIDLGGRSLEVLLTPGHTPDSLCLLDRQNKLLFTGDTFYAGPIFLYVPETNVPSYQQSVRRLASLVPQLELLLPSHNFPAEKPEMLSRLEEALRQVQSGKAKSHMEGGHREYEFEGFSILMAQ